MTVLWVLLGIAVLCGVALVASGRGDGLSTAEPDRPDLVLPRDRAASREDVDRLRFSVGLRGYRMDEVDDVLDRLAADIAMRDRLIGELERDARARALASVTPAVPVPATQPEPATPEPDAGEAGAVEGAALVPPVEVHADAATSRTLLVPLEQVHDAGEHRVPRDD